MPKAINLTYLWYGSLVLIQNLQFHKKEVTIKDTNLQLLLLFY